MKTVVITGATSGIGFAVAEQLLSLGYNVLGIGRSRESCDCAVKRLKENRPEYMPVFFAADLMQCGEVTRAAQELSLYLDTYCGGNLYALISNAGCVRSWYSTTNEGYEQQFALNHLAGFLLTGLLLGHLKKTGGRIIITGSSSHRHTRINWQDVMLSGGYNPLRAYKQSKLCNMLFARELNNRFSDSGIRAYVVDPGLVKTDIGNKQTGGLVSSIWSIRKSRGLQPETPAKTYSYLCQATPAPRGLYFHQCREKDYSRQVTDENAQRLFSLCERLCGVRYGEPT